jgi:hypothetical protein
MLETTVGSIDYLSIVDLASPGVSRGGDGRGTVASDVIGDSAPGLDLSASVGRDLNRARPVAGQSRESVVRNFESQA